jgi:glycosyltransferase involved in cell wall biosynthesis
MAERPVSFQGMPRVLIVRGHLATPWELRPWEDLAGRFDVSYLRTASNGYDTSGLSLREVPVGALRDRFPKGRLGEVATGLLRDRYTTDADAAFANADIVHSEELSFWFAADAARRRLAGGNFRLVQTVWETLPLGRSYRSRGARGFRDDVLAATDLFLAATERAKVSLLLEGVDEQKILVCEPGIDSSRFAAEALGATPTAHVILSPGRLVWEKGHQDALRALALLHRGIVKGPAGETFRPRLRIIGNGPERERIETYAAELGLSAFVEFDSLPYDEMPNAFAEASCLLLGSLSAASGGFHPFDIPHLFWEEQFGLVFAEAMAAGLGIITTTSGAIPEVLRGEGHLVAPGDYVGMAEALAAGPLTRPPAERAAYPAELVEFYSAESAAARLADAYDRVLG